MDRLEVLEIIQSLPGNKKDLAMSTYDNIIQEGRKQGIKQGIELGIEQGMERGMERGIEQGKKQGIEQGMERGIEQGKKQGIEQGIEQGISLKNRLVVIELIRNTDFDDEKIALIVGTTLDFVAELRAEA